MTQFWHAPLHDTVFNSRRLASSVPPCEFSNWLQSYAEIAPTSSNQGAANIPFQRWFHFKEAFSPKFVADTLSALPYKVDRCLDPFGGSGTTAITCRMLGIASEVIEVNPFLADLIEAKLAPVPAADFCMAYDDLISNLTIKPADRDLIDGMPVTLREPGIKGRYIFNDEMFATIRALVRSLSSLPPSYARLLKVLLGSVLVSNSNVTINGKGRRYRRGWELKQRSVADLITSLDNAVDQAAEDLTLFSGLCRGDHMVYAGDARSEVNKIKKADAAIFSPPYPNSFDYTDVYNLELWMLGYLNSSTDNRSLRNETMRSHVQTKWRETKRIAVSDTLDETVNALGNVRADLWNRYIPEMVRFYFDDLVVIFQQLRRILEPGHHAVVAIGDSQYAGIHVDVGAILAECLQPLGFRLTESGAIRSMRNSSQHGGGFELSEHCLVFERL